ncbi:MAG: ATP-binding protein, partial [Sphingomonadaceae bacterium]|nr:ATP-binding protein [Sphingomonadaceae bacterium]
MTTYAMHVTVSPDMIQKSTRLFNGTPQDIINELFQNSRRAGANIITVDAAISDDVCSISITDNGCGIDHPGKVVTLGTSAWGQDV